MAVGQHGLMGKQNVYEHSVGVPLMIKAAAQHTGKKTADLCYLIDVFPTLCDMLQLPVPQSVDGISLLSSLDGKEPVRDYLYYSYMDNQRGISDGTWKSADKRNTKKQSSVFAKRWLKSRRGQMIHLFSGIISIINYVFAHTPCLFKNKLLLLWSEHIINHRYG